MHVIYKALHFIENGEPTSKEVDYALLAARVTVAIFFITHGYGKLFGDAPGIEMFTMMLAGMGFPLAGLLAWLVGIAELFGGIAILFGVFTRFSSFWLAIISFVAWTSVKGFTLGMVTMMPDGTPMGGGDIDLLALGLVLALFFAGPGRFSASHYFANAK